MLLYFKYIMYRYITNQTSDLSELRVQTDLISRGWMVSKPVSRDCIYDLIIERYNVFETIQIKTLNGNTLSTTNRISHTDEPVSKNGKSRNKYRYCDFNITWLVGIQKHEPYKIYYYPLDVYKNYEHINVSKLPSVDIGRNVVAQYIPKKNIILNVDSAILEKENQFLSIFDIM